MTPPFWNLFPDNPDWSLQTLRLLAAGGAGGSDVSEIYRTATGISARTWEQWSISWGALADEVFAEAVRAAEEGNRETERAHLLRASNYYRHAEFYVPEDEEISGELYTSSRDAFRRASDGADPMIESVEIPYESQTLDGYLVHPHGDHADPGPVVIFLGGADSTAEELYFIGGRAIADRGMYCLIVDTPGRGSAVRLKHIYSRPDYEVPVAAVLAWSAADGRFDPDRIGLWGVSMGGYYAPRAAGRLDGFAALACWCGCFDVLHDIYDFYPPLRHHLRKLTGAPDEGESLREILAPFSLAGVAEHITCPTLIVHPESDALIDIAGARRLYSTLTAPKRFDELPAQGAGRLHCSWDYHASVLPTMTDWLADRLVKGKPGV
jgi:dipeptidyl aminopeptidase/acylaminoacyl peptidase